MHNYTIYSASPLDRNEIYKKWVEHINKSALARNNLHAT
jgi:hypothetical protein